MRVLFATDGSRSADRARDLLARLPWPDGTRFCVACAIEGRRELLGAPFVLPAKGELEAFDSERQRHADVTLDDAERTLERPGVTLERITLVGRAASAIADEARAWKADLVVLGNRGHGPIASMVLGSVSAEVVDHAPCPVLVARDDAISSIVLAEDGSPGAARASEAVGSWPIFARMPVEVVSVAETMLPMSAGMAAGLYDEVMASYTRDVEAAREGVRSLAAETAAKLATPGRSATAAALEGDPAHEIVEFARARPGALVVVGTRGHGGLARLVLGSVARNVLLHAGGSVLIVRDRTNGALPA